MKIIVDKQTAIKAICELLNLKYEESYQIGKGYHIEVMDEIIFDFEYKLSKEGK